MRERIPDKCKVFCLNNKKPGVAFHQDREDCWVEQVSGGSQELGFRQGEFEMLIRYPGGDVR